ncbi:MAG: CUAEP/CCAEP-tail radical SAM protein [Candidatus Acidiferrum sp.]
MITENDSLRRTASYTVERVNIVLISTYELGRQPFGLASPAAWLRNRGHEVVCLDLSRQSLDEAAIRAAGLIAIYLPMHTATRLAAKLIPSLRELNPLAHLCCYGLYAPMNADYLRTLGVTTILGGEFEQGLTKLAERLQNVDRPTGTPQLEPLVSLERLPFEVPDRSGLPPIGNYAHLVLPGGGFRIVGSTEASRGCKHLCRHCPIVPVYKGVFRIVSRDVVMQDIRQQVAAGAQHISFGDPDFFNGIRHAIELVEEVHREFPGVTYDVTIKIEHLRKYESYLPKLKETGCLFVISAVEYLDDDVLRSLDKGHTREDFLHVVRAFRTLGMVLHPTFVPFTQWTTMESYLDLLNVIYAESLMENVAPIQLGIRLLIPEGSRLLELDEVRRNVGPFDSESLFYPWKHSDPRVDALSETVQAIVAEGDRRKESRTTAFERIWKAAHAAAGLNAPGVETSRAASAAVPFLSEPWYCCAEPTREQFVSIGQASKKTEERTPVANGYV